ncbi:YfmQ family protein [Bacillus sp. FJAT-29937]|uniref:YfmQ family protein n=1 Tax=Bacillus sp. FJAT-29937 TaxID=1720553 RepID=UPI0012E36670
MSKEVVYSYADLVDVVKQWKKKVASYSLRSEYLQKFTISNSRNEVFKIDRA